MTYELNQTKKQETHDAIYVTLLPPSAEVAKYGASSTELPLDLIRNEPRQELKGVPLRQQHYDEPQKQVLQKNSQKNGFTGALLTASTLKVMTYEGISSEVHIKASWFGKGMTNILHIYMHGIPSPHLQRHSVGCNPVRPPSHPTDIPCYHLQPEVQGCRVW